MKTEMDLDNLFKKGLEEPGNYKQYQERDWNALEEMLDKQQKRSGIIYWMPLAGGIAATLILALGWFLINQKATKNQGQPITKTFKHGYKNKPADNVASNVLTQPSQDKSNTGTGGRPIQRRLVLNKQFKQPAGNTIVQIRPKNKSFLTLSAVEAGHVTGISANNTSPQRQTMVLAAVDERVFTQPELNNTVAFNTVPTDVNAKANLPAPVKKSIKAMPFHPQMAITVLASSNINGVGSFSNSQAGSNAGVLFSLGFTKKFTISTGAIYAKTPYNTDFANYHTEYKFKTDPESVNADCRVLDIPLNVDYQLLSKGRNSFSIGSGLSSYIMLRENYHYNYATGTAYGPTDFDLVNKNRYFMGVLNIDATYQRKLNSKLSLALQPYLKLPLTDIGNGGVKLQTTGMSVGLAWNINSLTKH